MTVFRAIGDYGRRETLIDRPEMETHPSTPEQINSQATNLIDVSRFFVARDTKILMGIGLQLRGNLRRTAEKAKMPSSIGQYGAVEITDCGRIFILLQLFFAQNP